MGKVQKIWQQITPGNLGFMLNVDWLQPYEHSQYSVGVLYTSILNLPLSEQYKLENIIVVGCIPGPSEPHSMNSYLKPMVDELWDGTDIHHTHMQFLFKFVVVSYM